MAIDRNGWRVIRADASFCRRLAVAYREERLRLGLTQDIALPRRKTKSLQRLEQNNAWRLSLDEVELLARLINLTAEELIGRANAPPIPQQALPPHLAFLEEQTRLILNAPLLPWTDEGQVSLRFLWPDLVVPAPLQLRKSHRATNLDDWAVTPFGDWRCVAVIGPPGSGKTTTLRYATLNLCEAHLDGRSDLYPIYLHLSDLRAGAPQKAIESLAATLALPVGAQRAFIVDGVDEAPEEQRLSALAGLIRGLKPTDRLILGCRSEIFLELQRTADIFARVDEIVEVLDWDFDEQALPFALEYCEKIGRPDDYERLKSACEKSEKLRRFVLNPFHLTLILFLVQGDNDVSDKLLATRFNVYREFYRHWVARERSRGTSHLAADDVFASHKDLALALYSVKAEPGGGSPLDAERFSQKLKDSAFAGLLTSRRDIFTNATKIVSFRHETLLEYLLAESVLDALAGSDRLDALLEYTFEVNAFVREAFGQMSPPERSRYATHLARRYAVLAQLSGDKELDDTQTRTREQIIYYLGRLDLPVCPEVLITCFETDPDLITRRAAALGAILHGREDVESRYIDLIRTDEPAGVLNRSIQMVYFGDVPGSIYTYRDNGTDGWVGAMNAIIGRLANANARELRLRRWDLETLRSFLSSRPTEPLPKDILDAVTGTVCEWNQHSPDREAALKAQVEELKALVLARPAARDS